MCSTLSPTVNVNPQALAAAFVEVAEQSFFAFAEKPTDRSAIDERRPADAVWMRSAVQFESPVESGTVEIVLTADLARELAAAFAGSDAEELTTAMIEDAIGELCNMVCGLWLTRACPHERFAMRPPEVTETDDEAIGSTAWTVLLINDVPAAIRELRPGAA